MLYSASYRIDPVKNTSCFSIENMKYKASVCGDPLTYTAINTCYRGGLVEFLHDCLLLSEDDSQIVAKQIEQWQQQVRAACLNHIED